MMPTRFPTQMYRRLVRLLRALLLLTMGLFVPDLYGDEENEYELDLKNRFITRASADYALSPHSPHV